MYIFIFVSDRVTLHELLSTIRADNHLHHEMIFSMLYNMVTVFPVLVAILIWLQLLSLLQKCVILHWSRRYGTSITTACLCQPPSAPSWVATSVLEHCANKVPHILHVLKSQGELTTWVRFKTTSLRQKLMCHMNLCNYNYTIFPKEVWAQH